MGRPARAAPATLPAAREVPVFHDMTGRRARVVRTGACLVVALSLTWISGLLAGSTGLQRLPALDARGIPVYTQTAHLRPARRFGHRVELVADSSPRADRDGVVGSLRAPSSAHPRPSAN